MSRPAGGVAIVLAASGAAGAIVAAGLADGGGGEPEVVARSADGARVAGAALPPSGRFALAYRHSTYRAPAVETFRTVAGGAFVLEAVASPQEGVLDYYGIEGRRTRRGAWRTLHPARAARFRTLALAATRVGRRTLVIGGRRLPLYESDGRVAHLRIAVED